MFVFLLGVVVVQELRDTLRQKDITATRCLAGKIARVDLSRRNAIGVLADRVVVVAGRLDSFAGEFRVTVDALRFEGRAVAALLLGHDVLGSLQRLKVGVEEASLLADGLVASDHFQMRLEHFRLSWVFVTGGKVSVLSSSCDG